LDGGVFLTPRDSRAPRARGHSCAHDPARRTARATAHHAMTEIDVPASARPTVRTPYTEKFKFHQVYRVFKVG
jgi:hypothetical protein